MPCVLLPLLHCWAADARPRLLRLCTPAAPAADVQPARRPARPQRHMAALDELRPTQRMVTVAALHLRLWLEQWCGANAQQVCAVGGLLVIGTSLQVRAAAAVRPPARARACAGPDLL
jgi:hypothetical protein